VEVDDSAETEWIENGVEQLVDFQSGVQFQRLLHPKQGVTFKRFAEEVEQFAIASTSKSTSAIGEMIIGALCNSRISRDGASELMNVPDPKEKLREIARGLLAPLAKDALIAQAEDDEL
jgi:hypothetical protein